MKPCEERIHIGIHEYLCHSGCFCIFAIFCVQTKATRVDSTLEQLQACVSAVDELLSVVAKDGASNDALSWPVNLQAALDHASHAGGIKRTDTSASLKLVTAPGPSNGNVAMKSTSQDGAVRETLFRHGLGRLVSNTKSNDHSV